MFHRASRCKPSLSRTLSMLTYSPRPKVVRVRRMRVRQRREKAEKQRVQKIRVRL